MKKYILNINLVLLLAMLILVVSCGHDHKEGDSHYHEETEVTHDDHDGHDHGETDVSESGHEENHEEGLYLSKKQIATVGLEFGDFSSIKVNDYVKVTGTFGLPPDANSSVSAKSNGIVKGTKKIVEGDYINKGDVIAYLENPNFIIKQQEYLEVKAQLKIKKLDLERQKTLVDANAGVLKDLQNAEAEVDILQAKSNGLSKQLKYLGISSSTLSPENITQQIAITAPISGYISNISFHNGMYVDSSLELISIISSDDLYLELEVFEKDVALINAGQKISFTVPALGNTLYEGTVNAMGKEFNADRKTIRMYGDVEGPKTQFLKGLFVNAKICLNDNVVFALPENAIIQNGEHTSIYVAINDKYANEIEFIEIKVIAGATDNGYTAVEVIDEIPQDMQIVTNGAYYVYAQSKVGELAHEH